MIFTCCLLILGGVLCAAAYAGDGRATIWFLVAARLILGIGIGGEYPLAASSTAEDSTDSADRNTSGVGQVTAAILGNLLVQAFADGKPGENSGSRLEAVWRILFAIGVIPALVVCYFRFTAEESAAYKNAHQRGQIAQATTQQQARLSFILRHYGVSLLGTAGTWFLFDIVYYSQNLFSTSILKVVGLSNPSLQQVTTEVAFVSLMALPGYFVAVYAINRPGRKKMQLQGFFFMKILCLVMAIFWDDLKEHSILFIILYGLTLFFSNFGPNMSTFVLPTEIYGYSGAFYTFAAISLVSIPLTWFCVFDNTKGIDEMDADFYQKLHGADDFTRESFNSLAKISDAGSVNMNTTPGAYKQVFTPTTLV
ncbi:hypothetical protein PHYSODRAFT_304289 [Phytophthora sojae]|uniref:Major facilitator superfamily (MFS) profile domain-containing protein n=1 Tax=Phytophthora sojae (strain P6497) TaxID=1094619 RepID=G4ZZM3_PHYSP|nr:hypothetical protein PHYSODRAFT_304289 [Phytophthora sojae]EGZ10369.1 hypothetical protein PHYSODRAFT_304289 [Phytophthora sojae]|eukprot:XP_009533114.1 hypothetical protein PHYSODRAFT_304289 [Phytophthora sojae]